MQKKANILDWPKPGLDKNIWNEDNTLKPEVKKFILDFISSFAQANNFKATDQWITEVKFVGSLTTNCWNSNSDMDIHIGVDLPKFVEVERPEMSDKEASDYLDEIRKQVDQVKAKVPGTEHPTEIYFETEFTTHASQAFSGTYSVLEDKWLVEPHIVGQDFDISTLHPALLNLAKETASELDAAFGEIKRDVADIKELNETINDWPAEQRELFEKKLQKRLEDLEKEIKELIVIREDVAEKRKHYDAISEQEVRFKYLQKYFYMHVLTDLKTLLKQSPELSVKDIPVVENIMQQAALSKKEAAKYDSPEEEFANKNVIMIDFDNTIAHELEDRVIGKPMDGVKEALTKLKEEGYYLIVDSYRGNTEKGEDEIKEFMDKNEIPYDEIYSGYKPMAWRYIDNSAIQYTSWPEVMKQIEKSASLPNGYWIDPSGKRYPVTGLSGGMSHVDFIYKHFGVDRKDFDKKEKEMFKEGWSRISHDYTSEQQFFIQVGNLRNLPPYLDGFVAEFYKPNDPIKGILMEDGKEYITVNDPFPSLQEAVNEELKRPKIKSSIDLPIIDPKTFQRKEPYALFRGTQRFSKTVAVDLFDVFGEHPMINESNQMPTVTLDTLIKENIPIIGKEPQAADKQPVQDISGLVKTASDYGPGNWAESAWISPTGEVDEFVLGQKAVNKALQQKLMTTAQLGSKYDYSSTHFLLPTNIAEKIIRWGVENIPEEEIVHDPDGTKGIQVESHVTLKYGLLTDDFEEVKRVLDGEKAPRIKFGKTTFFEPEGKDYDVVVVEVESEGLQDLSKKLCSQVKCNYERDGYNPHVTVAYVNKGLGKKYSDKDIITGEEIYLDTLTFSPKEGEPRQLELLKTTEKESSFMPSNTDLAPSNDWSGDVGWPGNEEMDPVWPRDDGENYYSPMDDRPREKSVWWKLLNMFKKQQPLGKKEVEKEAGQITRLFSPGFGEPFNVIKNPTFDQIVNLLNNSKYKELRVSYSKGDIYVWDARHSNHLEMAEALGLSTYDEDFIRDYDDIKRILTPVSIAGNLQTNSLKTAKQWTTPKEPVNQPGMSWQWADYIYDYIGEMWRDLLHDWLGLHPDNYVKPVILIQEIYEDEGVVSAWVHLEFINKAGTSDAFMKFVISAKIEGEESIEPEGREFYEHLTDWEMEVVDYGKSDELEKTSAMTIQQAIHQATNQCLLYLKDEVENPTTYDISSGQCEDWALQVEKLVPGAEAIWLDTLGVDVPHMAIKYNNKWYDAEAPEGVDNPNQLPIVLNQGKTREQVLEERQQITSSYGPTNYKGPSVADELYQDSPYRMNVTYSPEEDEELMDQNGKGGYPNRWMSRHHGPYYTNEGKVVKMLEETSALENLPEQKFIPEGLNSQTAIMTDDGSIYWDDLENPFGFHVGLIKGLKIPVERIQSGGYIKDGIYYDYGPYSDTMRYVERELAKKRVEQKHKALGRKDIKADISGQVVNNILKLIQQTGGATYNLSKGNLVGTNAFAVAIYPDREQIVEGIDFDTLEGYIAQNEDLLSNSNNSFGAWVSNGKVYLDVVATVPTKEQAMELGYRHKQLAIFDLKNLVEIPLQRVASLNKVTALLRAWIDPQGQVHEIHPNPSHKMWVYKNLVDPSTSPYKVEDEVWKKVAEMFDAGWTRVSTDSHNIDALFVLEVKDLKRLPAYLDNFVAENFEEGRPIELGDSNGRVVLVYDPFPSLQKAVNKALRQPKLAAAVSDKEQQAYYDEIFSDRWRDSSDPIDGGNEYNKGWSELNGNDFPGPKDLDKERALLDQLEKPINRNNPVGLGEYAITYYDAFPDQGDQGGI